MSIDRFIPITSFTFKTAPLIPGRDARGAISQERHSILGTETEQPIDRL